MKSIATNLMAVLVFDNESGTKNRHERDFQRISDLGYNVGLGQETKDLPLNGIREWYDEETKGNHLENDMSSET